MIFLDDNRKIKAFWNKCVENQTASNHAFQHGLLNVAASRYYYSLRFAFITLFEKKNITIPETVERKGNMERNPYPGTWPKKELHKQAKHEMPRFKVDVTWLMYKAWELRVKGDYEKLPVEMNQLSKVKRFGDELLKVIENEINKT